MHKTASAGRIGQARCWLPSHARYASSVSFWLATHVCRPYLIVVKVAMAFRPHHEREQSKFSIQRHKNTTRKTQTHLCVVGLGRLTVRHTLAPVVEALRLDFPRDKSWGSRRKGP